MVNVPARSLMGKTAYSNGSTAPNRGPVSAQGAKGYLQRELAKKRNQVQQGPYSKQPVGRDGQSDRRSGVAANMKKNTKAGALKSGKIGGGVPGRTDPKLAAAGGSGAKAPSTYQDFYVEPPKVVVGPTGTINIPISQQFSDDVLAALGDYNAQLLDLASQEQQYSLEYNNAMTQTNRNYGDQQRFTLNDNSSRGVAFSSGYTQAVGRDAENYQTNVNTLNQGYANFQNSIAAGRANIQDVFNRLLQSSARQNAENQLANARSLAGQEAAERAAREAKIAEQARKNSKKNPKPKQVNDNKKKKKK